MPVAARGRVLGIVSGKGGVGKSALAVNLAIAASAAGTATLLIDGDLGLANADLLMGLVPGRDLGDAAEGRCALDEALVAGPCGLALLVVGARATALAALERGLVGAPEEPLRHAIEARRLTVLDLGAGIGAGVLGLARHCDPVWLVATPEPTSLADAYTTAKHLWERDPALRLELVVNRAPDRAAGERTHRALDRLARRSSACCRCGRCCRRIPRWGRGRAPGAGAARRAWAPIARRIRLLAESLVEELPASQRPAARVFPPSPGF
ncbi:MAG: P-loop NTPase [Myxococcota bacterium]